MARQEQVYFRTSLEQLIERCTKEIPESQPDMQKVVDDLKDLENRYSNFPGQVEQDPVEKYLITKTSFNRHWCFKPNDLSCHNVDHFSEVIR